MITLGYFLILFAAFWLIGPLLALFTAPVLVKLAERRLRSSGIPVAGDIRDSHTRRTWTEEQQREVRRVSEASGRDSVLWGRTIAASVASIAYIHVLMPDAAWWLEFAPVLLIWWMSKDRIAFPLVALGLQLATRMVLP